MKLLITVVLGALTACDVSDHIRSTPKPVADMCCFPEEQGKTVCSSGSKLTCVEIYDPICMRWGIVGGC